MYKFNGLTSDLSSLTRLSNAKSRSISAENFTGEAGKGGMATKGTGAFPASDLGGQGWKVSPSIFLEPGDLVEIANIEGPGAIKHIWITSGGSGRDTIIRFYWDDFEHPSVECPIGDFFANAFLPKHIQINSLAVCNNYLNGFNCYWEMPFRKKCRITLENIGPKKTYHYYQIDYVLTQIPEDAAYFFAQFRRENPLKYKTDYTIIDNIKGKGHYVGTYMTWGANNNGWWGEGEIKFFMDEDKDFPTICGTGTEDYFCGAYCFMENNKYMEYSNPYTGFYPVRYEDEKNGQQRFSMYRWHITDPVRFEEKLKVTMQALGWRAGGKYLALQDDISSVAYWYQTLPFTKFPDLPSYEYLEII